jgi:hypothetical protein
MLCPAKLLGYLRATASCKRAPPVECGSLLPPSAACACPRVLLAFTYSRAVIPSGVSPVFAFRAVYARAKERASGSTVSRAREISRRGISLRCNPRRRAHLRDAVVGACLFPPNSQRAGRRSRLKCRVFIESDFEEQKPFTGNPQDAPWLIRFRSNCGL